MTKKTKNIIVNLLPFISIGLFIGFWFLVAGKPSSIIPTPYEVYLRVVKLIEKPISHTSIWGHVWASTKRVLFGLLLACFFGIPFGLLVGWNKKFRRVFKPLFELIRPIPALAWIPLLTLWFGIGESSKIALVFVGCLMPVVVNTYSGVSLIPKLNVDVAKIYGASNSQIITDIVLPSSLSAIMAGISTAMGTGWIVVLAAEMISAYQGLGFLIIRGSNVSDLALVIFAMLLIGLIGSVLSSLLRFLERKLCPWKVEIKN
ncbi:MAG: ABC transporter permease [Sphaerochaetaceae bacterium]